MDVETLQQENKQFKEEIQKLIEKIRELEKENAQYKTNYGGGDLPIGFSGSSYKF